jgi:phage gp36-like protein
MAGSAYSSESDLNLDADRLSELTDTAGAQGVPNQTVLEQTSLDAQDAVDDRLQGTYVVPFAPPNIPPAIRRLHAKIWKRMLFEHRDSMQVPATVEADYQKALPTWTTTPAPATAAASCRALRRCRAAARRRRPDRTRATPTATSPWRACSGASRTGSADGVARLQLRRQPVAPRLRGGLRRMRSLRPALARGRRHRRGAHAAQHRGRAAGRRHGPTWRPRRSLPERSTPAAPSGALHGRCSRAARTWGRRPRARTACSATPVRRALTKRARRTIENAKPLIWTRELLRTIRKSVGEDYVDYGSGLIKSWTLFLGSRTVPARNPFGRTAADNASIMGAFMRHIFGHLKGQA